MTEGRSLRWFRLPPRLREVGAHRPQAPTQGAQDADAELRIGEQEAVQPRSPEGERLGVLVHVRRGGAWLNVEDPHLAEAVSRSELHHEIVSPGARMERDAEVLAPTYEASSDLWRAASEMNYPPTPRGVETAPLLGCPDLGRHFMRPLVLACIALLSLSACDSHETPAAPPAATGAAVAVAAAPAALEGPAVPAPAVPPVSKWSLDPENSSAGFVCKHVLSNVRGMIAQPSGTVVLDETNPANSKVSATLEASSISTGVEERDTHLKGADFFDVATYPKITFVSTAVAKSGANAYSVTGNLTLHGVTKPVTLAVAASAPFEHAGGIRRGIEATTSVNRKDFGLAWEFPGEGPGIVVGDTIKITIDAELVLEPN